MGSSFDLDRAAGSAAKPAGMAAPDAVEESPAPASVEGAPGTATLALTPPQAVAMIDPPQAAGTVKPSVESLRSPGRGTSVTVAGDTSRRVATIALQCLHRVRSLAP